MCVLCRFILLIIVILVSFWWVWCWWLVLVCWVCRLLMSCSVWGGRCICWLGCMIVCCVCIVVVIFVGGLVCLVNGIRKL